jgi:PAS domain S-box-containing protein
LIGQDFALFAHPDDLMDSRNGDESMVVVENSYRLRTSSGASMRFEGAPQPLTDPKGRRVATLWVLRSVDDARADRDLVETSFSLAPIAKALVGLDGRFLRVNLAFCEFFGLPEERMLELDFQAITHPDDLAADLTLLRELRSGRIPSYRLDKRYIRAEGSIVWADLAVSLVRGADGSPKHYVAQVQDLSARKAMEIALAESAERYRLIADNASDMIVTSDLHGRIDFISRACAAMIGRQPEDVVGRWAGEFMHPDDVPAVTEAFSELARGGAGRRVRWRAQHPLSEAWIWLESSTNLLRGGSGRPQGFLDVVRNVSAQVEQEAALAAARRDAEAAAQVKSQFLANMSHEIRTPLTAVLGYTELLQQRPTLDGEARRYVDQIAGAGRGLLAIVNDILDFSKLEAGQVEIRPEPTDLARLCQDTLEMFQPAAAAKGIALRLEALELPHSLAIDADRVRQVLINLVGNGVKFTAQGSVLLEVRYDPADARVFVEVRDTGPGLSPSACAGLFQRFSQVDASAARRHGGTGLGLAICKGLVEAMGGLISVESRLGRGSSFRFDFPAAGAARVPHGEATPLASLAGARVLVVDDNAANRELAAAVLTALGADVQLAPDGASALVAAGQTPIDIVLLDMRMPGMDGRETFAGFRAMKGPPRKVPILAFTADADPGDDCAGFDGVVRKPIIAAELCMAVSIALGGVGRRRDAA